MRHLLLVTTSFPDQGEGESAAGVFVSDFARALTEQGVAVHIVAPGAASGYEEEERLSISRFGAPRLPLSLLNPLRPGDWGAIAITLRRGAQAVAEQCQRQPPDHILALWALPSGAWAMRAHQKLGVPYSTWALGSDIWTLGRIPGLRQYLGQVMRSAVTRFADGLQLCEDVERLSRRPCRFLASSRDFGAASVRSLSGNPPYRLAFLGRWHPNKGIDLLLDALDLLSNSDWPQIERVGVFGGGPLETDIHGRIGQMQAAERSIEVGGYLGLEGARRLFDWADYVLIPSRIESIPVIFSDAMQARRPVIATPVGDLPRLLDSLDCGVLAKRADAEGIAAAIRTALATCPRRFTDGLSRAAASFRVQGAAESFLREIGWQ